MRSQEHSLGWQRDRGTEDRGTEGPWAVGEGKQPQRQGWVPGVAVSRGLLDYVSVLLWDENCDRKERESRNLSSWNRFMHHSRKDFVAVRTQRPEECQ